MSRSKKFPYFSLQLQHVPTHTVPIILENLKSHFDMLIKYYQVKAMIQFISYINLFCLQSTKRCLVVQ